MIIVPGKRPLEMNVTNHEGRVVIQFNQDVAEVALDVQDAAELARALVQIAKEILHRNHSN